MEKYCFITGHRPNRFHFSEQSPQCAALKAALAGEIRRLHDQQYIRGVWVGGAAGVDTWAAEIVLDLRQQDGYRDLELRVAIPFPEHGETFAPEQKKRYLRILEECTDSVVVCRAYRPDAYKKRDYYMVDRSVCGIAVYDLDKSIRSGTGMTFNYATKKKRLTVTLIHPDTATVSTENCV